METQAARRSPLRRRPWPAPRAPATAEPLPPGQARPRSVPPRRRRYRTLRARTNCFTRLAYGAADNVSDSRQNK